MTTESDRNRQNDGESKLTARQVKFLPVLLASPTYTQACQAGRVSRDTLYEGLKDPAFKTKLDRRRDELVGPGACPALSERCEGRGDAGGAFLDAGDGRLKRLAARDILDQHVKFRELHELARRIEAIEERLEARG
ncbi:MAG: hypothetical protein NTZ17_02795 [Phycisphaerae bacterium]|nr:hypothetical protein [Phycisphaerae bacterium]